MIQRMLVYVALVFQMGCYAATKSTLDLTKVEKKVAAAKAADAHRHAIYAWTMADSYMKKARDEWGHSDYEAAESMMKEAEKWADQALQIARTAPADAKWGTEQLEDKPQQNPVPQNASSIPGVWQ